MRKRTAVGELVRSAKRWALFAFIIGVAWLSTRSLTATQQFDTSIKSFLEVGDLIAPIDAIGLDGKPVRIDFSGKVPTVVYVMAPDSAYCRYNENSFSTLVRGAGARFRWILVSTRDEGLTEYIARLQSQWKDVPVTTVGGITADDKRRLFLGGTPQTIVVSQDGRVIHNFRGAYRGPTIDAVGRYFGVTLPHLD